MRGALGLALAGVAVGLVCAELLLRAAGYSVPVFHTPDTTLGWALRPGAHGLQTSEGRAWVRINSAGMRDREHAVAKPPGTYRIAVIGDSYAAAVEVDRDSTFWARLPGHLAPCGFAGGRAIEMLNFGVPGYGTAQEYLLLQTRALRYDPDLVLLVMTLGNDLENNVRELEPVAGRPFYELTGDGRLRLDRSFRSTWDQSPMGLFVWDVFGALVDRVRLLQLLHDALAKARAAGARSAGVGAELAPPRDRAWIDAWRVTERLVLAADTLARSHGTRLQVVVVSSPVQVTLDTGVVRQLADSLGEPDLFYPDRRLARLGAARGIPTVTLGPAMARIARAERLHLHGFGPTLGSRHWNEAGHRVAALLIARHLCTKSSA
ncbi:MAG TPA: SGNH/GDSL hydrolase family protein [Gemmatimonadales bacterium]